MRCTSLSQKPSLTWSSRPLPRDSPHPPSDQSDVEEGGSARTPLAAHKKGSRFRVSEPGAEGRSIGRRQEQGLREPVGRRCGTPAATRHGPQGRLLFGRRRLNALDVHESSRSSSRRRKVFSIVLVSTIGIAAERLCPFQQSAVSGLTRPRAIPVGCRPLTGPPVITTVDLHLRGCRGGPAGEGAGRPARGAAIHLACSAPAASPTLVVRASSQRGGEQQDPGRDREAEHAHP
jgi:hypothetical protein